ncbi:helix-turn-helix and ligand-binding sensor domain-containing protein [Flavobacterium cheongpyeongense]|nr:triple tyrosine motif-containing protein [Flavobacterium cheongpyeongense]
MPNIKNYKRNEYKGGTQNWGVDQDKNGTIYFANNSGLIQFDGSTWKTYSMPNNESLKSLKLDSLGNIFVGGNNEFGYFKPDNKGELKYFSVSKMVSKKDNQNLNLIWKIHIFNGEVIFQSFAKAFFYKNNSLRVLNAPKKFQFSFVVNNRLFFQDKVLGILEYKDNKLFPLKGTIFLNDKEIWGILPFKNNSLLLATLEEGLFLYDFNKVIPWKTDANDFIKKNTSLGGSIINNKFIILNSVLNGVVICDLNGKIIQHLNRQKGLQNNTILTSFIDNKNNLWLGLDNGIAFVNESSPFTYFGFGYNISTVYASVLYEGNLYVATNQGLFYHAWNDNFKEDVFKLVEGTTAQSWNVQVVDNELICANNRGALLIKQGKVAQVIDSRKGYFGFEKIPNHPQFFIGSNYDGFAVFQRTSGGFEFKYQVNGFNRSSRSFEFDQSYLWLKAGQSLYRMTLSEDLKSFSEIKEIHQLNNRFKKTGSIQKIGGRVYFQANNHFYKYSTEQEIFYEDKKLTALFKNIPNINELKEDSQSNLWYTYGESLGVLMKENNTYRKIDAAFSNLTGNLVNGYLSVNTINTKNIFIGLTDGLAHFDSKLLNGFVTKPKAFIRSFSFLDNTYIVNSNNQNKINNIAIPYSSNHVRFTFSSPTYENLENVQFSYQLQNFEEKWSNWSIISIKEYTNLREGDYVMKVKVRDSYGVQSEPSMLSFTISPPWYRHIIAYLGYLLIVCGCIYVVSNRIKLKIRKNKYYETIEQRRLYLEREAKIRYEQHKLEKEIEKLKSDKLQIKILAKDKELVNNSLQVVKKNKTLNSIISKLKEIDTSILDESTKTEFNKLHKSIVKEVNTDKSWKDLEKHIKNVHFDFLKRLKERYPTISPRELDLSTYLLMNMSTKEIAEIMNISNGGVELARYRLRKKLGLNKKENLIGFLMSI